MANLTPAQLDTLRHMLGINTPADDAPKPYRDYYCAPWGMRELHELQRLGMVERYDTRGGYEWFCTTPALLLSDIARAWDCFSPTAKLIERKRRASDSREDT